MGHTATEERTLTADGATHDSSGLPGGSIDLNAPLNTSLPDQARVKLDLAAARAAVAAKRQVEGKLPDSRYS